MKINVPFTGSPEHSRSRVYWDANEDIMEDGFSRQQFAKLAGKLDVPTFWPEAIAQIETNNQPFTVQGVPVVRFEPHHWRRRRADKHSAKTFDRHKNSRDLDRRWRDFLAMAAVDESAAIQSHSFGAWQIMGFNHVICGYGAPTQFLRAMMEPEGQMRAFVRFCMSSPQLLSAMRRRDEKQIAHHYNGPRYAKNRYHLKLANWRSKLNGYEYHIA